MKIQRNGKIQKNGAMTFIRLKLLESVMGLICSPERKVCDMGYYFRGENTDTIKTRKQIQEEQQEIRQFVTKLENRLHICQ